MTTEIILRSFLHNDRSIPVPFTGEAFFNATVAAKAFGKLPKDWLKTQEAQDYIDALSENILLKPDQLVVVKTGAPDTGGGSWFHPDLVVAFARWLHPRFAVWCDMQVRGILRGKAAAPARMGLPPSDTVDNIDLTKRTRNVTIGVNDYNEAFVALIDASDKLARSQQQTITQQQRHIALLEKLVELGVKP